MGYPTPARIAISSEVILGLLNDTVTFTGGVLGFPAAHNLYCPSRVFDDSLFLQHCRRQAHRRSVGTHHGRNEIVSDRKLSQIQHGPMRLGQQLIPNEAGRQLLLSECGILPDHFWEQGYQRGCRIIGWKGIYGRRGPREILFVSIASTAESFRSTCGSVRKAPECSKQGSPGATPHVGQGTEDHCFAVKSLFLILIRYGKTSRKTVPF
ncbi:MAG: hypothetical protein JWN63_2432 [Candidatus Acidoferrum typicum]|nr:hypothetical protein [Candidatus Acidoferrum typicum]